MLYLGCKLTKIKFKEVLTLLGTKDFAVLSAEELEMVSGGYLVYVWDNQRGLDIPIPPGSKINLLDYYNRYMGPGYGPQR